MIYQEKNAQLLFIIYDGIQNSVFQSQVLHPILKRLKEKENLEITLVSFEQKMIPQNLLEKLIPAHDRLHVVIFKRLPICFKLTLYFAVAQLKKLLQSTPIEHIITRGPLAGWVAMTTLQMLSKSKNHHLDSAYSFTVQARGLCSEEFRYTIKHSKQPFLKKLFYHYWFNVYETIEHDVYSQSNKCYCAHHFEIEAVSTALKDYLIEHFGACPKNITIANKDIPPKIDPVIVKKWRQEVREELSIPENTYVYCYAGSARAWQCVPETINFFEEEYTTPRPTALSPSIQFSSKITQDKLHDKNAPPEPTALSGAERSRMGRVLLILSQEKESFKKLLKQKKIPKTAYRILSVRPNDLFRYLSAADVGLLFRKTSIINWVSRPTKMLEYQSVGLKIIHNNTVGCLVKQ